VEALGDPFPNHPWMKFFGLESGKRPILAIPGAFGQLRSCVRNAPVLQRQAKSGGRHLFLKNPLFSVLCKLLVENDLHGPANSTPQKRPKNDPFWQENEGFRK
jgi:hypothetical protein